MEKHIHELFNDEILNEAAKLFGVTRDDVKEVGGFENFIYEYRLNNEDYILRITHSDHRSYQLIESELDFVNYLASKNANVSVPVRSINQKLVEVVKCVDESYFIITSYVKAKGTHMSKELSCDELFINYGKTVGKFHRLTKDYKPSMHIEKRYYWYEDLLITEAKKYLPQDEVGIYRKLEELVQYLKTLPKNANNFGLIHTDIHMGNFFVHENNITVFDFDDCSYQYFISDIAIALFYFVAYNPDEESRLKTADYIMNLFMKGYLQENEMDHESYHQLPYFLKLRELIVYIVLHRSCDLNEEGYPKQFVTMYKDRILNDIPFLDLDFSKYLKQKREV